MPNSEQGLREALENLLKGREGLIMIDTADLRKLLTEHPAEPATPAAE